MTSIGSDKPRQIVLDAITHLDHVLPGQAPIHDFVHHNTLHGFQHLPFEQALAEFSALTGIDCYQTDEQFRRYYQQGRISDVDLDAALERHLARYQTADAAERRSLYRLALLNELSALTPSQLRWQLQEGVLNDPAAIKIWQTLLTVLDLPAGLPHPEEMLDLSHEQADSWLPNEPVAERMLWQILADLDQQFVAIGESQTLRDLLHNLTGQDLLDQVRPQLIKLCASFLDEGLAAWHLPDGRQLGLYRAWRQAARIFGVQAWFQELPGWQSLVDACPDNAVDAIVQQLQLLALPVERWSAYLQRLALELPGWSGMINWRQHHPGYHADEVHPELADYLALRLIFDRLYAQPIFQQHWHCDVRLDKLQNYFAKLPMEFAVRNSLWSGELPEYLVEIAQTLLAHDAVSAADWQNLAEMIWTWRLSPLAAGVTSYQHGWRLFVAVQAMQLDVAAVQCFSREQLLRWLALIDEFDPEQRGQVWLDAYEQHYRQNLLQALHANRGRGRWLRRDCRPQAQIIFCMDDREESIRRHLEEINPAIETLGAAGFFGLAMNYRGLDDEQPTALCPVVVTPVHEARERIQRNQERVLERHRRGGKWQQWLGDLMYHGLRRDNLLAVPLIHAMAPFTLAGLLAKSFRPWAQERLLNATSRLIAPEIATRLDFTAADARPATTQQPRLGFTDTEQADRVAGFLRNTGLTYGFAELVVLMGHGSSSQNNPHLAAYDCGACSGRHGGPNARLFAAMANRPAVRSLLAERGIQIPDDTWFLGVEHNTGNESMVWYDFDMLPTERQAALQQLQQHLTYAKDMSAHERCRRLASAPRNPQPKQALQHFLNRSADFSQARPELGHATNAAAFVGRRAATQGAFFDRRLFLISYDPSQDPEGTILEGILLAVGPVGAGINLEYYFSTVNNDRLGCGSKTSHNLVGFFAVMEGAGSDLRTGLPRQMIEVHEAMRLQMVVEAKTTVLEAIYARQPSLQELIGGGWVHLSSQDPDSGELFVFQRGVGFVPWQPADTNLPVRESSQDCYRDACEPVDPMLIKQPLLEMP